MVTDSMASSTKSFAIKLDGKAEGKLTMKYGEKEAAQDINVKGEALVEFKVEKGGEKDQVTFVYEGKGALNLRKLILK